MCEAVGAQEEATLARRALGSLRVLPSRWSVSSRGSRFGKVDHGLTLHLNIACLLLVGSPVLVRLQIDCIEMTSFVQLSAPNHMRGLMFRRAKVHECSKPHIQ